MTSIDEAFARFRTIGVLRRLYLNSMTEFGYVAQPYGSMPMDVPAAVTGTIIYVVPPHDSIPPSIPWFIEGNTIAFLEQKKDYMRRLEE